MNAPLQRRAPLVRRGEAAAPTTPQQELRQATAGLDAFRPGTRDLADKDYQALSAKIRIDKNNLDQAVVDQAQVFLEICERHAQAVSQRDLAKDTLARIDAELAQVKRIDAAKNSEKLTAPQIDEHVLLHPRHAKAQTDLADSQRDERRWGNLRDAFDQRMRMIRELVSLFAAGYWTSSGSMGARDQVRQSVAENNRAELAADRQARNT